MVKICKYYISTLKLAGIPDYDKELTTMQITTLLDDHETRNANTMEL